MIKLLGVTNDQLCLIQTHLREVFVKTPITIFAFGSRVEGGHRKNSDLDLLLESSQFIDLALLGVLKERFEESTLPFKIDLLEGHRIPSSIRQSIKNQKKVIIFQTTAPSD